MLYIDDIDSKNPDEFVAQLSKMEAIKSVARKIISFLVQIEEFQKKLWLKKKFVISTDYCITLDKIPKKYYPEIANNHEQIEEWKRLFDVSINSEDELSNEPFLVLDTKFFNSDFKDRLIGEFDNLDEETDGVLINSENFQALTLMTNKYFGNLDLIYFDPPYNTDATPIIYKNEFKESSWLSLIENRLNVAKYLINKDEGAFSIAIDDTEVDALTRLLSEILIQYEIHKVIVNHYPGSGTGRTNVSRTHEYNLFAIPIDSDILRGNLKPEGIRERNFRRAGTGENNYRTGRPNSFYAIIVDSETFNIMGVEKHPLLGDNYPIEDTIEGYKRIYPIGNDGAERVWTLSYEGAKKAIDDKRLYCTQNFTINRLYNDQGVRDLVQSLWLNTKFSATVYGTKLLTDIFGNSGLFSYPKSVYTVKTAIDVVTHSKTSAIILDYFAGSGTTGHATIKLNREDGGNRKYILVEMGEYFDTVTKPRMQKVIYSDNWKNGKPQDKDGISQMFKYQVLESYEDALNNLKLKQNESQLEFTENVQEEYLLKYMLDMESRDHLFDINIFKNPFNYQLKVTENNELLPTTIDLVETFNYLIGLYVERIQRQGDIKFIEGTTREGEKTLVIWRNLDTTDNEEVKQVFRKLYESELTYEFEQIYINGYHNFQNYRVDTDVFKVKLIEEEFFKRMFEV